MWGMRLRAFAAMLGHTDRSAESWGPLCIPRHGRVPNRGDQSMLRRRPLMRAAATTAVVAGTATAVSGRVARRQQARAQPPAEAEVIAPEPTASPQEPVPEAPQ